MLRMDWAERLAMSAPSVLRGKYFEGSGVVGIFIGTVVFALLAPLVGGLIDGVDRKLSARMQGRVGRACCSPSTTLPSCYARPLPA